MKLWFYGRGVLTRPTKPQGWFAFNIRERMGSRRFTRLTNAFSKKVENHAHSVAIHTMHYNFVRIHQTHRCTPAMAAKRHAEASGTGGHGEGVGGLGGSKGIGRTAMRPTQAFGVTLATGLRQSRPSVLLQGQPSDISSAGNPRKVAARGGRLLPPTAHTTPSRLSALWRE